jgi:hypothetical protein
MKLNETFDSTIKLNWKQESKDLTFAEFEVDNIQYECFIEAGTYEFEGHELSFLNTGFSRVSGSDKIFDLTLETKDSIKVLGAVINGVSKKIEEYHADAVMLSAVDNVEKRMRIYQWIARKFSTKFGIWIKSITVPNGKVTLLISSKLDKALINKFEEHVKQQNIKKL